MIILLLGIIITIGITILTRIHGYIGAILLGLSTVGLDFFWQWLRLKFVQPGHTGRLFLGVFGGLAIRVVSIFLLLKLAEWWLGGIKNNDFIIYAICLLLIPFVSILIRFIFKQERKHNGDLA